MSKIIRDRISKNKYLKKEVTNSKELIITRLNIKMSNWNNVNRINKKSSTNVRVWQTSKLKLNKRRQINGEVPINVLKQMNKVLVVKFR